MTTVPSYLRSGTELDCECFIMTHGASYMCKGVGDALTLCRHCLGGVELGLSSTIAFHAILFDNTSANQAPCDDYHVLSTMFSQRVPMNMLASL